MCVSLCVCATALLTCFVIRFPFVPLGFVFVFLYTIFVRRVAKRQRQRDSSLSFLRCDGIPPFPLLVVAVVESEYLFALSRDYFVLFVLQLIVFIRLIGCLFFLMTATVCLLF